VGGNVEEVLKGLRAKQRVEVDRLKKRTNYDETRTLLERYDEKLRESVGGIP
jgi:coproporphyrinogen III oxidase-like Fe-S oxidoreductase